VHDFGAAGLMDTDRVGHDVTCQLGLRYRWTQRHLLASLSA